MEWWTSTSRFGCLGVIPARCGQACGSAAATHHTAQVVAALADHEGCRDWIGEQGDSCHAKADHGCGNEEIRAVFTLRGLIAVLAHDELP